MDLGSEQSLSLSRSPISFDPIITQSISEPSGLGLFGLCALVTFLFRRKIRSER